MNLLDDIFGDVEELLDKLEKSAFIPKDEDGFFRPQDMTEEEINKLVEDTLGGIL